MTEFSKTYGGALYALAQEEHLEDELLSQLESVCALLKENPEYIRLIESRAVLKAERLALLDSAFGGQVEQYLLNFMKILCERNAFGEIFGCRDAFIKNYNDTHGIVQAKAVSATPLTENQRKRLVAALVKKTGRMIELEVTVDPSLGSGIRVEMEGRRFDNSVASRMNHLRQALLANS